MCGGVMWECLHLWETLCVGWGRWWEDISHPVGKLELSIYEISQSLRGQVASEAPLRSVGRGA